jgi:hypothetical protein
MKGIVFIGNGSNLGLKCRNCEPLSKQRQGEWGKYHPQISQITQNIYSLRAQENRRLGPVLSHGDCSLGVKSTGRAREVDQR